jgi:XTP/dITP diphosphohydrolase
MSRKVTLYIASTNAGKLRDFAAAAGEEGFRVLPFPGIEKFPAAPEEQPTFEGNSRQKAIYYSCLLSGEFVVADDSGLEVEALGNAPGVRSARYARDAGYLLEEAVPDDERNNLYLLHCLSGVPEEQRRARYCCVLAAARDGRVLRTGRGSVEGRILTAPRGTGGFGYDPLFYLPELKSTMAEIGLAAKDAVSHRGKALRALLAELRGFV